MHNTFYLFELWSFVAIENKDQSGCCLQKVTQFVKEIFKKTTLSLTEHALGLAL